jgi:hypothetical protein
MYDLIDSVLPMLIDVYRQFETQDPNTGSLKKEWQFNRTVPCSAKGTISNSTTNRSGDKQNFSNKYVNEQMLQIRTTTKLIFSEKITNIRGLDGTVIWEEINFPSNTPTVFEVMGVTPITEPLGGIIGYNTMVKRSENQVIGQ